jgi:hypothetical protein
MPRCAVHLGVCKTPKLWRLNIALINESDCTSAWPARIVRRLSVLLFTSHPVRFFGHRPEFQKPVQVYSHVGKSNLTLGGI